ncbi:acetyltransferase [Halobacillus sp. Nhm2S1]|nr:acetyltransferase [Halobacillus sp. Nhm2S1]
MKNKEEEKHFSFRPLDAERDVDLLYDWMHQKHIAPFWKLNLPKSELASWAKQSEEAEYKDCYIGTYEGEPVCYLIAYSIKQDPIKGYYNYYEGDLGMHLLIGPRPLLNKEDGLSLIRAMIFFLLDRYDAERIIGEPDRRNRIVVPILKELGGEVVNRIQLPHKQAFLTIGEKEAIVEKLKKDQIQMEILHRITLPEGRLVE